MNVAYDIAIIGAGAMGSAAAYHLSKTNLKVLVLDKFLPLLVRPPFSAAVGAPAVVGPLTNNRSASTSSQSKQKFFTR